MRTRPLLAAFLVYAAWMLATWFYEGRIETLLRPDAAADRAVYAFVANILIGTLGALSVLALILRTGAGDRATAGLAPWRRALASVAVGFAAGFSLYSLQGGPIDRPIVVVNAFAQVLVVSIAEVAVCWALVAGTIAAMFRTGISRMAVAAVVASLLFGVYHFAHSAPFNTLPMVALLTGVGLITSFFFLVSRDLYGTIVFHNWLGVFGVVQALSAQEKLDSLAQPQLPVLVMAGIALLALLAADGLLLRRA